MTSCARQRTSRRRADWRPLRQRESRWGRSGGALALPAGAGHRRERGDHGRPTQATGTESVVADRAERRRPHSSASTWPLASPRAGSQRARGRIAVGFVAALASDGDSQDRVTSCRPAHVVDGPGRGDLARWLVRVAGVTNASRKRPAAVRATIGSDEVVARDRSRVARSHGAHSAHNEPPQAAEESVVACGSGRAWEGAPFGPRHPPVGAITPSSSGPPASPGDKSGPSRHHRQSGRRPAAIEPPPDPGVQRPWGSPFIASPSRRS